MCDPGYRALPAAAGFAPHAAPSALLTTAPRFLICHAAPVRHARLRSVSGKTSPRPAAAGLCPSRRSIRAAHDGSALLNLSRCACSPRAASLRFGQNQPPPCGGGALPLAPLHPRCSRRLRASYLSRCEAAGALGRSSALLTAPATARSTPARPTRC